MTNHSQSLNVISSRNSTNVFDISHTSQISKKKPSLLYPSSQPSRAPSQVSTVTSAIINDNFDILANHLAKSSKTKSTSQKSSNKKTGEKREILGKDIAERRSRGYRRRSQEAYKSQLKRSVDMKDKKEELKRYSRDELLTAIEKLSKSQSSIKSMDGAAHTIGNSFSDKSSLRARFKKFLATTRGRGESAKVTKEAAKVMEYVTVVERSLQAAEILQTIAIASPTTRHSYLHDISLREVNRFVITDIQNNTRITISVLQPISSTSYSGAGKSSGGGERKSRSEPRRYIDNELIIAMSDDIDNSNYDARIPGLLDILYAEPMVVELQRRGFVEEEAIVQKTFYGLANEAITLINPYLYPPTPTSSESNTNDNNSHVTIQSQDPPHINLDPRHRGKSLLRRNRKEARNKGNGANRRGNSGVKGDNKTQESLFHVTDGHVPLSSSGEVLPSKVRFVGYSAGGAVAALSSMILHGSLVPATGRSENETTADGGYRNRVKCVALGAPPCVSRAVIPQYVTSLICGDDVIPRAYFDSLDRLYERIAKTVVAGGAGTGLGVGSILSWGDSSTAWVKDLASITKKGLQQYAVGGHDLTSLSVPGRVFFLKSRLHKKGATIQRVLRGNWKEDILWLLHEILLSKKMFHHHTLNNYINTLARC